MPLTRPTPRARPVTSAPPISPRAEDSQGYRRGRAIRSCLECRRRKMRCNRSRPCQNCNRFCRDCVYLPFPEWPSGASNSDRAQVNLQSPVQGGGRAFPPFDSTQHPGCVQPSPLTNHDHGYNPHTLAKHDTTYDTDADDDFLDVALQIGRLSITERLGGYCRPHVASQIATLLSRTNHTVDPYSPQNPYGIPAIQQPAHAAAPSTSVSVKEILPLEPSPGFLTTASRPYLPQPGPELPTRNELKLLYCQFWSAVDPLAHIVHRPSFEGQCRRYLLDGHVIEAAPVSFKALLLAMCLAAAVSLPLVQAKEVSGVSLQSLVGRLKLATEKALTNAGFMTSVNIQTLQAFTIYLIPQCRAEISKSHANYVGALVRLAMSAGLNHDPSGPGTSPVDCQVRRLLWHQICFLDVLTAEAQGPHTAIHDDQFDTSLPLNINDDALGQPNYESAPTPIWTDATLSIIRYECSMLHRLVSRQRLAMDLGQTDLKTVQHLVSAQKVRIERQYLQYLDESIPIQRYAKLIGQLFTARFDALLLHRHSHFDVNTELPAGVRETLIQSCLTVCECAVKLDTDPELTPWAWYARAHHQYERSIFLLMEIYRDPLNPYADRINRVLDHVFGATPNISSRDRSRNLLLLLVDEFNKLMQLRKIKVPQLAVSDNGSSSPNDHSGMVSTPEDNQQWSQWQPEGMYGQGYGRDLPPVTDSTWWPIPVQHGMLCGSTVPQHDGYINPQQHGDYDYGMGLGPAA